MNKSQVIIYVVTAIFVAFRLYQKYGKKKQADGGRKKEASAGRSISDSCKDDDYEPYSGKQ